MNMYVYTYRNARAAKILKLYVSKYRPQAVLVLKVLKGPLCPTKISPPLLSRELQP